MSTLVYPLPNALVIIIRTDGKFATWGYTDSNGRFSAKLPKGIYDVFVVGDGFAIHHQIEVIDKDRIKTIFMKPIEVKIVQYVSAYYVYQYFEDFKNTLLNLVRTYPDLMQTYPNLFDLAWAIVTPIYGPCYIWCMRNVPPGIIEPKMSGQIGSGIQGELTVSLSGSITEA